jgi:multiple sugar transport system permease protein
VSSLSLPVRRHKGRSRRASGGANPWYYVTPAIVLVGLLTIAPLIYGLYLSFTNWTLTTSPTPSLEGIGAYKAVLSDPNFLGNLWRTIIWTVGTVIVEVIIAVPLAMLLNLRTPITGAVTGFIMIPWITPFVVLSYAWLFLYDGQSGPLHAVLQWLGLAGASTPLANPSTSLWSIIIISGWKGVPFLTIALLAARKGIADEIYEAAATDGATRFATFRRVTLPLLTPTLGAMCVVLGVQAFYSFDLVWILTQGGPGTSSTILGIQLFQAFFLQGSPGQAAALGTIMLLLAVIFIVPILRVSSRRND